MTDTHRKPTRLEQDLASQAPEQIDFYIRKMVELAKIGVKKAEHLVAQVRGSAEACRAGTKAEAEHALMLDEAVEEYERVTRAVRLSIRLSMKLQDERRARQQRAAAGTVVVKPLDPRLKGLVEKAIAQLAEPYKRPTRH